MRYLVMKKRNSVGSYALKIRSGQELSDYIVKLNKISRGRKIQFITVSRPSAYGEYEPYHFVNTKEEFESVLKDIT